MSEKDKKEKGMIVNSFVLVLQLSLSMIVPTMLCTIVCFFIAKAVDNRNITIFGIIIGIIAGINGAFRQVKKYIKEDETPGQRARRLEEEKKNDNKMDEET